MIKPMATKEPKAPKTPKAPKEPEVTEENVQEVPVVDHARRDPSGALIIN